MTTSSIAPCADAGASDDSPATQPGRTSHGRLVGWRARAVLVVLLALAGSVLFATRIDGVFIIDDNSHLATVVALRAGRLTAPGTDGLPVSPELLAFDAAPRSRLVTRTPVSSPSPPLYAVIALPFSAFGWPGLVALQVLAFLGSVWLVFETAAIYARRSETPWLAAAAFGLGSYAIEYAQGLWPHMLSVCLTLAAVHLVLRVRAGASPWLAMAAGLAAGVATGVRYQNLVFSALLLAGLALFCRQRRGLATLAFVAGITVPLLASATINAHRLDSWNPVSKGPQYLDLRMIRAGEDVLTKVFHSAAIRLVTHSLLPPPPAESRPWFQKDSNTSVYLVDGAVKKAWLQSAPWILLSLAGMAFAWRHSFPAAPEIRTEIRAWSLVVAGVIGLFALYGYHRHDGLCYNERYLFELVPLAAVTLAWVLEGTSWSPGRLLVGAVAAALTLASVLYMPDVALDIRFAMLAWPPLLLASLTAVVWRLLPRSELLSLLVGACIGWAFIAHLGDDLRASRWRKQSNREVFEALAATIPPDERNAIFARRGTDGAGPLTFNRDTVLVDPWIDDEIDAPMLFRALLEEDRAVYFIGSTPSTIGPSDLDGLDVKTMGYGRGQRLTRVAIQARE